jgi:hypothetical protein
MLDMIGANGKGNHGQEAAEKPDPESHGHWDNPFRKSPGPHGKPAGSSSAAAQFWKQPRRWLHVDANGKTTYVTVCATTFCVLALPATAMACRRVTGTRGCICTSNPSTTV